MLYLQIHALVVSERHCYCHKHLGGHWLIIWKHEG